MQLKCRNTNVHPCRVPIGFTNLIMQSSFACSPKHCFQRSKFDLDVSMKNTPRQRRLNSKPSKALLDKLISLPLQSSRISFVAQLFGIAYACPET